MAPRATQPRSSARLFCSVRCASSARKGGAHRIEFEVGRVDDDVDAVDFAQLPQLWRCAGGLHRTAPRDDVQFLQRRPAQRLERMQREVGRCEMVGTGREDPDGIHRDVADADDCGGLVRQVEGAIGVVGMAVVPGDKFGGRVTAGEVLTRDT